MGKGQGNGTDTLPTDNGFTRKEYIEREAVVKLLKAACKECRETCEEFDGFYADCNQCIMHSVVNGVPSIPAADVVPVRHGRWKKVDDGIYYHMECSECGCRPLRNRWVDDNELSLFCHNCGAKKDGDGDA